MKAIKVALFTNRNSMVFGEEGNQIVEYQKAISCYNLNRDLALSLANEAKEFSICKFDEWCHEISREEFLYLLGMGDVVRRERERRLKSDTRKTLAKRAIE